MPNYYQPEIETASREQILAWQNERLVKQVQHVYIGKSAEPRRIGF